MKGTEERIRSGGTLISVIRRGKSSEGWHRTASLSWVKNIRQRREHITGPYKKGRQGTPRTEIGTRRIAGKPGRFDWQKHSKGRRLGERNFAQTQGLYSEEKKGRSDRETRRDGGNDLFETNCSRAWGPHVPTKIILGPSKKSALTERGRKMVGEGSGCSMMGEEFLRADLEGKSQ